MDNLLQVCGLCKRYGAFSLEDVSFEVPSGYVMGFIGPNGAGKTTTIKAILNMVHRQSGAIRLFGKDIGDSAARVNEEIGVVMDTPLYADDWTIDDVEKAVSPFYRRWDKGAYAALLARFDIDRRKKVKALSRGMKVKLMLAVALSHDARLLILDEPTSGLDPVARDGLCDLLSEFVSSEDRSVLFSTHITADLEKIADYITFILGGRVIFTGPKEALLEKYALVKGAPGEIGPTHRALLIGLREHATGFDAMIETASTGALPGGLLVEPITLDEIIVYMNRGGRAHA